jgi:alpha-L-fucosidase
MSAIESRQRFEPTWASLRTHEVPAWYRDAKLGAIIHWTPSSVPAWAPIEGDLVSLARERGFEYYFAHNPYTEWYQNTIRIDGSPSQQYHRRTYGVQAKYSDFAPIFREAAEAWDPEAWAATLAAAGFRYVVFVAKHHDGFLLWPSSRPNPFIADHHLERDVIGELATAVRRRGIRFGLYYSGGLDWSWNHSLITDIASMYQCIGQSLEYAAYVDAHWRELIERYRPDILWGDIGYPAAADLERLFADYYNAVPEGVVNDRFAQKLPESMDPTERVTAPTNKHYDYITPEYSGYEMTTDFAWESTRGIGLGFGYNRNETRETHASSSELIRSLVDVTSKNGNLLLGIGPMADGTIPAAQLEPLLGLGRWLEVNGEAVYGTRPRSAPTTTSEQGVEIRFTRGHVADFAAFIGDVADQRFEMPEVRFHPDRVPELLGHNGHADIVNATAGLTVRFAADLPRSEAYVVRIPR